MFKMNGVLRSSFKLTSGSSFMNVFRQTIKTENAKQRLYSTFWNSCLKPAEYNVPKTAALWSKSSCLVNQYSTKVESELAEFLEQEINAELKIRKEGTIPSKIDDFEVKLNGSEVTLIKKLFKESIEIKFNVNYSITDDDIAENENDYGEIKAKPEFDIIINRGFTTLQFSCSFGDNGNYSDDDQGQEQELGDLFAINDVCLYEGERKDTNYSVSASILDGTFYDLMMNFLDEKGVTNEFVDKMSALAGAYEHSSYISLLRDFQKYISS